MAAALGGCSMNNDSMGEGDNYRTTQGPVRFVPGSWRQREGAPPVTAGASAPSGSDTGKTSYTTTGYTTGYTQQVDYRVPSPPRPADTTASVAKPASGAVKAAAGTKPARTLPDAMEDEAIDPVLVRATRTEAPRLGHGDAPAASTTKAPAVPEPVAACKTPASPETVSTVSTVEGIRLVNCKRIAFNYEIKDAGPAGVVLVDLWGTQDMKTWKKYEPVAQSPHSYVVEVKDEGLYGFTMQVRRGGGEKDRPVPGDVPQVWVGVDMTAPTVQFLGADPGAKAGTPSLVLRWKAHDKNLGPRPVTLSYAEKPAGPWLPIAANVENCGHYDWELPAALPASLYVKVQAADLMGNVGCAKTPSPLHIVRPQLLAAAPTTPPAPVITAGATDKATATPSLGTPEPDKGPQLELPGSPTRLTILPPPPPVERPKVPVIEGPRPQVSIVSIEADHN
jgi:hypothetical protein